MGVLVVELVAAVAVALAVVVVVLLVVVVGAVNGTESGCTWYWGFIVLGRGGLIRAPLNQ